MSRAMSTQELMDGLELAHAECETWRQGIGSLHTCACSTAKAWRKYYKRSQA